MSGFVTALIAMLHTIKSGDEVGAELTKKHGNTLKTVAVSENSLSHLMS